jgi:ATP-dependent Lon protease
LYNFLESGEVVRTLRKEQIRFNMPNCKVIATSNSSTKLAAPLKSRFLMLSMKTYTYDEFLAISEKMLTKRYGIPALTAREVGDIIWNVLDTKDVRMIDHIGSRINVKDTEADIERFVRNVLNNRQIEGVDYN